MKKIKLLGSTLVLSFTLLGTTSSAECTVNPTGPDVCADVLQECSSGEGICVVKECQEPIPDGNPMLPCKKD